MSGPLGKWLYRALRRLARRHRKAVHHAQRATRLTKAEKRRMRARAWL